MRAQVTELTESKEDLIKSKEYISEYSIRNLGKYLEALSDNETLERALLDSKKILRRTNKKARILQRKIRTLYNENVSYRSMLAGQGINIIRKNSKEMFDKILLTTRKIREKITTLPNSDQEPLDKVLISTRFMRQKMIKPQKIYKIDSCESMDSILMSTLCMRKWAGMVNCQDASKSTEEQKNEHKREGPTKICNKSKTINIIRQNRQISTGTLLVGGLAMILLFIARPTRAGDYPYTEH